MTDAQMLAYVQSIRTKLMESAYLHECPKIWTVIGKLEVLSAALESRRPSTEWLSAVNETEDKIRTAAELAHARAVADLNSVCRICNRLDDHSHVAYEASGGTGGDV